MVRVCLNDKVLTVNTQLLPNSRSLLHLICQVYFEGKGKGVGREGEGIQVGNQMRFAKFMRQQFNLSLSSPSPLKHP